MKAGASFRQVQLGDLSAVAEALLQEVQECRVWCFVGEMGAGKTTLIKEVCKCLGVTDTMSSPTFSIVNEYRTASDEQVFHFDFFRLKNVAEAYDIGAEDYFYSGNYCFIEWPEKVGSMIPDHHARILISADNETFRTIAVSINDREEENRV